MYVTNIDSDKFFEIIDHFRKSEWKLIFDYENFDKSIDFDLVILRNNEETITFGWDNWVEGEIFASEWVISDISSLFDIELLEGEPLNLKPSVVELYFPEKP